VSKLTNPVNLDITPEIRVALADFLSEKPSPAEAAGITSEQLEALYALGRQLYIVGQYNDAEIIFQSLCLYDQGQSRFWLGLGGVRQNQGRYEEALASYFMATELPGPLDSAAVLSAGLCWMKLGDYQTAQATLAGLETLAAQPHQAVILEKARNILAIIKTQGLN
jgi:type III secretion system low calcium response chaperone LcrH/SycD